MSEIYADSGGFKPLPLPSSGYLLQEGRQYNLDVVARAVIADVYGLRNLPTVIECLSAKSDETEFHSFQVNKRTGEQTAVRIITVPASDSTFRAFPTGSRHIKFTIDLEKVADLRAFYAEADKVSDEEPTGEKPAKIKKAPKVIDLSILDI